MLCLKDDINNPVGFFEIKGSKFITYFYKVDSINFNTNRENNLQNLIIEHKKARHFVESFRILNEFGQIVEGSSDDGEPKGSSGAPILEVLRGENIINVLCICVRYFGGVKLGIGGLVRAYTQSVLNAVLNCKDLGLLIQYEKTKTINIESKISNFNKIEYLIKKYNLKILKKDFKDLKVILEIQGSENNINTILQNDLLKQN